MADQAHIRNFSIIAHIDHGKSTLADRILELTHTVDPRAMRAQLLDSMELERERGITIKAQAVRVFYESPRDGQTYQLHLIDTPGHVDFTYEVSRSLAACEGALLVVDASQGVEAQTVANTYLAIESGLELIPCLNKVDLPGAEPERVAEEVAELLGEPADTVRRISAKTGEGVTDVLDELIARVPPPSGDPDAPPRALIFDSEFDQYRGVIAYIRVVDGTFTKGEAIRAMQAGHRGRDRRHRLLHAADDLGERAARRRGRLPDHRDQGRHQAARRRHAAPPSADAATEPLPGYREVKPMVFCGLFPIDSDDYPDLRDALEKLTLNDAALSWEPETSRRARLRLPLRFPRPAAHGHRARAARARVRPRAAGDDAERRVRGDAHRRPRPAVHSPNDMPDPTRVAEVREPYIRASILTPKEFVGPIMELCQERRGDHAGMHYLSSERAAAHLRPAAGRDRARLLRPAEVAHPRLRVARLRADRPARVGPGQARHPARRRPGRRAVDAGAPIKAYEAGRTLAEKLRKKIPRQQYDVPIQAAIGSRIVARETIKAYRKDVTAKCYGGDITRKRKLLEQQKKGKQRMKQVGRIEVPQEAFLAVLELGEKG